MDSESNSFQTRHLANCHIWYNWEFIKHYYFIETWYNLQVDNNQIPYFHEYNEFDWINILCDLSDSGIDKVFIISFWCNFCLLFIFLQV